MFASLGLRATLFYAASISAAVRNIPRRGFFMPHKVLTEKFYSQTGDS